MNMISGMLIISKPHLILSKLHPYKLTIKSAHTLNMAGVGMWAIVFAFLSVNFSETNGQEEQQLGDLTFVCKNGWRIYQSDCYMEVDVMMTWDDARDTCHRQGGNLLWLKNEMEYYFVKNISTTNMFWTGLQYDDGYAEWSHTPESVDLKTIFAFWGDNEPNTEQNGGDVIRCAVSQGDMRLALKSCSLKLPFVCKYQACLKGHMPCATGGGCFSENDKCDGRNDCDDMSDERDCRTTEYCSYYYKLSGTASNIQTSRIEDGTRCSYVLEAPIGKRIRLTVPGRTLEEHLASIEIWTGSPDLKDSKQIARLTGQFQNDYFISVNNFMTILLIAGDISASSISGMTFSWTTDISEIFDGMRALTADGSWRSLSPTFTRDETPMELQLSWIIEAPAGEVIMYYLDSYDKSDEASLKVQEGAMADDAVRNMDPDSVNRVYYGSAASTLQVHWNSGNGMSSFNLRYKTGCDMAIDKAVGAFSVPIFWKPSERYPSELTCEWDLTGGTTRDRGLTVHFILIQLEQDPRADQKSKDLIKLYMDESTDNVTIDNNDASGMMYHADGGHMKVEFMSDLIINDGVGFIAQFSVDCPPLDVSEWTQKSVLSIMYDTHVTLSCLTGYKFDAQEYYGMTEVELFCKDGGIWTYDDKMDIRIPNCEVVQCGIPYEIQNGYILNVTGTSFGETAEYECNDGFSMSNPAAGSVYCDADGSWQNVPTCSSATCSAFDIQGVSNGDYEVEAGNEVTGSSVDFDTVLKFNCVDGYEVHGSLRTHCRNDGWSDPKPECRRIVCPPRFVDNAVQVGSAGLAYGESLSISCQTGYSINGTGQTSVSVICKSSRMLMPYFECTDINECDNDPCDSTSTRCENTDGSHKCACLDGFKSSGSQNSCDDIRECDVDNGGCSDHCEELDGSYQCDCPLAGWDLFTEDGTSGYYIPMGETGYRFGDVYYYNHTCVKKACVRPEDVDHGTILSLETLFHYDDSVELVCEDGYYITGYSETTTKMSRTCKEDGWDIDTCSARTCSTGSTPDRGSYDNTTVSFGEKVELTCQWTETTTITRTATCIYDGGVTRFGGDDITTCPEIDCGNPSSRLPNGGRVSGFLASTKHLDHPTFTFDCLDGSVLEGKSEIGEDVTVECKENGRWSFGTLRCSGQTCNDPRTPAGATQMVTNYEVGQELYYTCDRDGYVPEPDLNYTCVYSSGSATWSNGLENNLPECVDRTKPEIKNLPITIEYRDRMDKADIPAPFYSDNFGVKSTTVSQSIKSEDIISESVTITYTAEDYDNNVQTATVDIEVIDRTDKPILNCPNYLELPVSSVSPEAYNVSNDVNSDGTLQFSQEMVTVSVNNIGTYVRIDVTARNEFETEAYCSFLVTFIAITCFKDTIYPDSNANRDCIENGDGFICSSKCRTGYIYGDGANEKNFTCSGQNMWDFNYPHVFCLATESPAYQFTAYVVHDYSFLSGLCESDYATAIGNRRSIFKSEMKNLCSGIEWDITSYTTSLGDASTEFKSEFTVKLLTTAISDEARTNCIDIIRTTKEIFNLAGGGLFCQSQGQSYSITTSSLDTTSGAFDCVTQTFTLIDSEIGKKCIPCGPGQFYDQDSGFCTSCPEGQYQDQQAGICQTCNSGETANSHKTDCIITCPPGFISDDGLLRCRPCEKNFYWVDSMTCTACGSETSTSGREGAVDMDECYSSCPEGEYSRTGYVDWPCKQCPRNFYQPSVGQTTCMECLGNEVTDNDGQTSEASCHDYAFPAGESCNRAYCNDHGNCGFQFHRPVCTCDAGYTGERCDTPFHICNSSPYSPCMNEATCIPGNTYTEYTCECREELNIDLCFQQSFTDKEGGNQYSPQQLTGRSLTQCQNECLQSEDCKSLSHYTFSSGTPVCLIYDVIIPEVDLTDRAGRTHYNRDCPPVYAGDRCEVDLVNDCTSSNNLCSDAAMCKDKVLGYECLCPSVGGYQGQYCDQTEEPCDSFPCQNGGSCQNFGNIRYECTCTSGYTGVNCETNINECDMNPDACPYGGDCIDRVNAYTCSCASGFGGVNCENTPNYCASKNCFGNTCYNSLDHRSGRCECEDPYYVSSGLGDFMCNRTSAEPCDFVLCVNGTCNNQARCVCESGFTGSQCQHSIDDCTDTSCLNGGECIDVHQGYECNCQLGFTGNRCETNIDDCEGECGDNGDCIDGVDSFTCDCDAGYTGTDCETEIDECLAIPCLHGGVCNDSVNGYECECQAGWTGTNCEEWNNRCTPSPCNNDGECFSLREKSICRCGGGTQGQFCDDKRSVCETVSHVDVCMNGGTCEDMGGTANCHCPTVPDMDRCFTTVHDDVEGGNTGEISTASLNINLDTCKQKCLDNSACQSLSYFVLFGNTFCKIYDVKMPSSLTSNTGGRHFERDCPTDYAGVACEQAKNWCDNNPCKHEGRCTTNNPIGFQCDCETGYTGTTCEIAADPCSNGPCPNAATCRASVTEYYCQCPMGREVMGGNCRTTSRSGYILLLVDAAGSDLRRRKRDSHGGENFYPVPEDIPTLKSPFRMSGGTLSVMFWVRVHKTTTEEPYNLLRLVGSDMLFPLRDEEPELVLLITNTFIRLTYNMETLTLDFDEPLERAEWYHIGVALSDDRQLSYTINAVEVPEPQPLQGDSMLEFDNLNAQVVLGDADMVIEFKRVTVWETALSNSIFAQAFAAEEFTPPGAIMTQGWWNYKFTKATKLLTQELDFSSQDKSVPKLVCDTSPYEKVSAERILRRSSLVDLTNKIDAISTHGLTTKHSIPEDLTWGYYSGVVVVEANGRYAECRFPVYIKYYDRCPAPVDDSDLTITTCDDTDQDGVCGLQCLAGSVAKYISAPTPKYRACGVLGVYYWNMPHRNLVLPSCAVGSSEKYVVKISMQYELAIPCQPFVDQDTETDIENEIRSQFYDLNTSWRDICEGGSECTNLHFSRVECNSAMSKRLDLVFSLNFIQNLLVAQRQGSDDDGSMRLDDALKSIIVIEEKIDLSRFATATLVTNSVVVTMTSDCTTTGYNFINNICVPCGKGLIYNSELEVCEFCPMGTYKDENDVECRPCGDELTTIHIGTTSVSNCVDYCDPGRFYDVTKSSCQNCPRHTYQDQPGQSFCHPCALGFKSQGEGSALASDCKEDCPAGFDRNETGVCVICERGYWRDLSEDDCQSCDSGDTTGYTTIPGEIAISRDKCEMVICPVGKYWSIMNQTCNDCPYGKFQDEVAMLECKPCEGNKTTETPGATNSESCVFYCSAGYEVNENEIDACLPCGRGYYKNNTGNSKFEACIQCTDSTTDDIAAESEDLCEYEICDRGEVLDDKMCDPCPVDYYQPVWMVDSTATCIHCPNKASTPQGTEEESTHNETECKPICPGGQQFDMPEMECVDCEVGAYKPEDDRFGQCMTCPENFTTDGTKKTTETECDIPLCAKGDYVKDKVCTLCEIDTYQPDMHPAAGVTCTECPTRNGVETGTKSPGADSEDYCEPICPGGYKYNEDMDDCVKCPVGKYKPDTLSDRFESCYNCTEGFINDGEGKMSVDTCTIRDCPPGSYDNDTACVLCRYGFYQMERTQKNCDECGTNLNTSREGATSMEECQAFCGAGEQTTTTSQALCEKCPPGKYKEGPSYEPCQDCPLDFTSNDNRTACTLQFCSAGKEYKDLSAGPACVPCQTGKFKAAAGNSNCEDCPAGSTTVETGQSSCDILHCEAGKYEVEGQCELCDKGFYKSAAGNGECTVCPTGKTSAGKGSDSESDCNTVVCPAGYYRKPDQLTACTPCALNEYQNTAGLTSCSNCPAGQVTMAAAATDVTDCVPECPKGKQYKSATKSCDACPQRYYKNTVGNFQVCTECQAGKTTVGTGATDQSECSQTDCSPGSYVLVRNNQVTCPLCPIGQYQPERSEFECLSCGADSTTSNTGSTSLSQCQTRCPAGEELIFPDKTNCHKCEIGMYNDLSGKNPNICKDCPPGFTNSAVGKANCPVPVTVPIPQQITVTLMFVFIYKVETDCSLFSLNIIQVSIRNTIRIGMNKHKNRYRGNCGINQSNCNFVNVDFITISLGTTCTPRNRRKRELTHDLEVTVTMPNATNTVTDTEDNNSVLETANVVAELFESNPGDFSPTEGAIEYGSLTAAPTVIPVCEPGYIRVDAGCAPCATGQYWSQPTQTCLNCKTDEYQDEAGQTECKNCPDNTYSDVTAAKEVSVCKSYCEEHSNFCNNRGTCSETGRRSAQCSCNSDYSGSQCESKQTPSSNTPAIIGGTIGGIVGLLVLILILVAIYRFKFARNTSQEERRTRKKTSHHSHHSQEEPEYLYNPIYDNRNGAGYYHQGSSAGTMPAVFATSPAVEYYGGGDPYGLYSSPNKHKHRSRDHSEARDHGETRHEGEFMWQA